MYNFAKIFLICLLVLLSGCVVNPPLDGSIGKTIEERYQQLSNDCGVDFSKFFGLESSVPSEVYKEIQSLEKIYNSVPYHDINLSSQFLKIAKKEINKENINDQNAYLPVSVSLGDFLDSVLIFTNEGGVDIKRQDSCKAILEVAGKAEIAVPSYVSGSITTTAESNQHNMLFVQGGTFKSPLSELYNSSNSEHSRFLALALLDYYNKNKLLSNNNLWFMDNVKAISINAINNAKGIGDTKVSLAGQYAKSLGGVSGKLNAQVTTTNESTVVKQHTIFLEGMHNTALPTPEQLINKLDDSNLNIEPVNSQASANLGSTELIVAADQVTNLNVSAVGIPELLCLGQNLWNVTLKKVDGSVSREKLSIINYTKYEDQVTGLPSCRFTLKFRPDAAKIKQVKTENLGQYSIEFYLIPTTFQSQSDPNKAKLLVSGHLNILDLPFPTSNDVLCTITPTPIEASASAEQIENVKCNIFLDFNNRDTASSIFDLTSFKVNPITNDKLTQCLIMPQSLPNIIKGTTSLGALTYTIDFKRIKPSLSPAYSCRIEPEINFQTKSDNQTVPYIVPVNLNFQ